MFFIVCSSILRLIDVKVGNTPLHHASLEGHVDIVSLLLDSGAQSSAQDDVSLACISRLTPSPGRVDSSSLCLFE
jgi:ankyrin repeat protein